MSMSVVAQLQQVQDFQFDVDFGDGRSLLRTDEPAPLGKGEGPSPGQLLAAAVGNCLAASLLFALRKFKQDPSPMTVESTCRVDRNPQNRLRIEAIDVQIRMGQQATSLAHLERALETFEGFCTVSQSVSRGIPISISVVDSLGQKVK